MSVRFIGITPRLVLHEAYGELRECLACEWGAYFSAHFSGEFLPLPLSYKVPFSAYLPSLHGVILSGGNDLFSVSGDEISRRRDSYENTVIAGCLAHNLPLLGICRGAQKIAEYFGASLKRCCGHVGEHKVQLCDSGDVCAVNSYHNYCIKGVGAPLKVLASADDGSIEAFCHKYAQILGLMWHIERDGGECGAEWIRELFGK